MIEVHVPISGWRPFPTANGWGVGDDGTLRLAEIGAAPKYEFKRWVALFAPGGWQGLATLSGEERPELGFRLHR